MSPMIPPPLTGRAHATNSRRSRTLTLTIAHREVVMVRSLEKHLVVDRDTSGSVLAMRDSTIATMGKIGETWSDRGARLFDKIGRTGGAERVSCSRAPAISSRGAHDHVAATIEACELVNPNGSGVAFNGPSGRGV